MTWASGLIGKSSYAMHGWVIISYHCVFFGIAALAKEIKIWVLCIIVSLSISRLSNVANRITIQKPRLLTHPAPF
jgi:hypothetical protein